MSKKYLFLLIIVLGIIVTPDMFYTQVAEGASNHINQCTIEVTPANPTFYKVGDTSIPSSISVIITVSRPDYQEIEVTKTDIHGSTYEETYTVYYDTPKRYVRAEQTNNILMEISKDSYQDTYYVDTNSTSLVLEIRYINGTLLDKINLMEGTNIGIYVTTYVFPKNIPVGTYIYSVKLYDVVYRYWYGFMRRKQYFNDIYTGQANGNILLNPIS